MYKFKFEPPQQHRRSLQVQKNDNISLLNTLDKCSQILRQDRLWIRNQIKNNNSQIIAIFKQYSKGNQFQNLQVKLRKYVQNIKSKIKQEQLSKFRQTLHTQQSQMHVQRQLPKRYTHSNSRSNLKSNSSLQFNKTTVFKHNKSQEHYHQKNVNQNQKHRQFQDLLKYKYHHDVIQERESENVTSARLHRQENQKNQNRALQEIKYNPNYNMTYQFFNQEKHQQKPQRYQKEVSSSSPWEFEKRAKQNLYQYQQQHQNIYKQPVVLDIQNGFSRIDKGYEEKQESIFDKHFNESEKVSASHEHSQNISVNDFKNVQFGQQSVQHHFELKQQEFNSTSNVKKQAKESHSQSVQENLFTPQELLNQCRNFLKNRENSTKKEVVNHHFEEFLKHDASNSSVIYHKPQEAAQCLFSRDHFQENQGQNADVEEKKEEQSYMFPQIGNSQQQSVQSSIKKEDTFVYPHFETFANSSNQKFKFQKAISSPQDAKPQLTSLPILKNKPQILPSNFSIQDFLDQLMQFTDMNPFISSQNLQQFLQTNKNKQQLQQALKKFLNTNEQQICLTTIAETINIQYNKQHEQPYPFTDNSINSVYNLLDIDLKGSISREDVQSFLIQIKQAQVQNFQQVSSELQRLFEGSDFTNEQRLTYWHFYIVKSSEQFERVQKLLSEFEFQIERQS